jgi:protein SCO1
MQAVGSVNPNEACIVEETTRRLCCDTQTRGKKAYRGLKEYIPENIALYNQEGQLVLRRDFQGSWVVLNFFFTGCLDPQMCPATIQRMVDLNKILKENFSQEPVRLVSISFDPQKDSPDVLKQYGSAYGIRSDQYWLLTGNKPQIDDLMKQFGVLIEKEDGTLQHTSSTLLINPQGQIVQRQEGKNWRIEPIIDRISKPKKQNETPIISTPTAVSG